MKNLKEIGITVATIDVTYKCNYRCLHCYNSSGEHNFSDELTDKDLLRVMEDYCELNPRAICICGGEPLLRKDIVIKMGKMFHEAHPEKGCNMVTNGFYMTSEIAAELKEAGFNMIQVSLDGFKSESHNWLRNNSNAYEKTINAIKILKEAGLNVGVACAPSKVNISEFDDLISLCFELGVSNFRTQPMMNLGRAINIDNMLLNDFDYLKLGRKINLKNMEYENKGMKLEWGDPVQHLTRIKVGMAKMDTIIINAYGDILLSPYLPLSFGNIRNHSIVEYFDAGLCEIYSNELVQKMAGLITNCNDLNLNSTKRQVPPIFTGNDIKIDLIDDNVKHKTEEYIDLFLGA